MIKEPNLEELKELSSSSDELKKSFSSASPILRFDINEQQTCTRNLVLHFNSIS